MDWTNLIFLWEMKKESLVKLYFTLLILKTSLIMSWVSPWCTLYNSAASTWKFFWWIVTELSSLSSSSIVTAFHYKQLERPVHEVCLLCYSKFSYGKSMPRGWCYKYPHNYFQFFLWSKFWNSSKGIIFFD